MIDAKAVVDDINWQSRRQELKKTYLDPYLSKTEIAYHDWEKSVAWGDPDDIQRAKISYMTAKGQMIDAIVKLYAYQDI